MASVRAVCSANVARLAPAPRARMRAPNALVRAASARRATLAVSRVALRVRAEDAPAPAAAAATKEAAPKKKAPPKSLPDMMLEDIVPGLEKSLKEEGASAIELKWINNQLRGSFMNTDASGEMVPYNFWCFFPDGTLLGQRGWSMSSHGFPPSTVEPFIIDEKRIDASTVIFWVVKRLMAQKSNLPGLH